MPKRRRWLVRQSGPRVSPGMKGRSGSTQEHASKEEVAPTGVIVIRTSIAEQGFHPGRKPHPDETETSSSQTPLHKAAYRQGGACQPPPQKYHHTPRKDRDGPTKAGQVHRGTEARSPATTDPAKDRRGEDATRTHSGAAHEEPDHPSRHDAPDGAPAAPGAPGAGTPRPTGPKSGPVGPDGATSPPGPCVAVSWPRGRLDRAGGRLDRTWLQPRQGRCATTAAQRTQIEPSRAQTGLRRLELRAPEPRPDPRVPEHGCLVVFIAEPPPAADATLPRPPPPPPPPPPPRAGGETIERH
jgi:hypothetical protein